MTDAEVIKALQDRIVAVHKEADLSDARSLQAISNATLVLSRLNEAMNRGAQDGSRIQYD